MSDKKRSELPFRLEVIMDRNSGYVDTRLLVDGKGNVIAEFYGDVDRDAIYRLLTSVNSHQLLVDALESIRHCEDDIRVTAGVGSGTVACRLRNALIRVAGLSEQALAEVKEAS